MRKPHPPGRKPGSSQERGQERGQERTPERGPERRPERGPERTAERPPQRGQEPGQERSGDHARGGAARPDAPAGGGGAPWLWGRHAVLAALANPERKLLRLVATAEEAATLTDSPVPPQIVAREELARLLPAGAVHQGLALLAKTLRPAALEDVIERAEGHTQAAIVVLDQVSDPHNVGAILRSAAAFGALALVVPERNAPEISGTLAKSASGAVEHVPIVRVVNLTRALEQLKKAGFWTVGLDGGAERTLAEHRLDGKVALVLGSEGDGLRRLTREACDLMARLPTAGPIASLNVSNAAAIALYELARAR